MTTITAKKAGATLYDLIKSTVELHQPITIKGKDNNAILVSENDWKAMQETLFLLSIPNMRESIQEGLNTPIDECETELDW